jgi:CheY-like chemotaxis protein
MLSQLTNSTTAPPIALLVDHDADTRELYSDFLTINGYAVDHADDGREALARVVAQRPDVIVTETALPLLDGYHLVELLRHDGATKTIPIIVVTADAFPADVDRARAAGADAVLLKPCLPETLLKVIAEIREQSRQLRHRASALRDKAEAQLLRSQRLVARSERLSKRFLRYSTAAPPVPPPALICPECDSLLQYANSQIGGVNETQSEQWDYFTCSTGCGSFQYRHRTRKLTRIK